MVDGPVILDKKEETEPVIITEQTEQTLQQQLNSLQSWDTQEGQTLEQRREVEQERIVTRQKANLLLLQNAQQQLGEAPPVEQVAGGGPPVQAVPAKQTYKQKREEKRRDKEARKHCPVGDHISYGMIEGLTAYPTQIGNSMTEERYTQANEQGVDTRVLQAFVYGHKTDRKGRPRTEQDSRKKKWDDDFLDAYISKDIEKRKPYLKKFTADFLAAPLDPATLSDANLEKNAGQVRQEAEKLVYFKNIYEDEINKTYFDSLSEGDRELIAMRFAQVRPYTNLMNAKFQSKGVNFNYIRYYEGDLGMEVIQQAQQSAPGLLQQLEASNATTEQRTKEIAERQMEREYDVALASIKQESESLKEQLKENTEHVKRFKGITLTSSATLYDYENIADYREMIEKNATRFDAHKELLSAVYQEYYRAVDTFGDLEEITKACQAVQSSNNPSYLEFQGKTATQLQRSVLALIDEKAEVAAEKHALVKMEIRTLADVMQFYLREKPLSDPARAYLVGHGIPEADLDAELKRREHVREHAEAVKQVQEVFGGESGFIAASNKTFQTRQGSETEKRAAALVDLGIRTSNTKTAIADKRLKGDTFVQLHLDILDTFKELNDGEPMAETALTVKTVAKGTVFAGSEKMAVAAFAHGGGIDALNDQIFTQFSEYVQKPECLEYLRVMTDVLKDAAVFGGNPEEVVEYLIQGIANSYTLIYQGMAGKMASEGTMKESTAKVAKETAKSVMAIPALSRLAPEELALYPESVQALVGRFKPLVQLLAQKIAPAVAV